MRLWALFLFLFFKRTFSLCDTVKIGRKKTQRVKIHSNAIFIFLLLRHLLSLCLFFLLQLLPLMLLFFLLLCLWLSLWLVVLAVAIAVNMDVVFVFVVAFVVDVVIFLYCLFQLFPNISIIKARFSPPYALPLNCTFSDVHAW